MSKVSDYRYAVDVEAYRKDTPSLIMRFLESESVNDRSPNTIKQHYYTLKGFYKFVSWRAGRCGKDCHRLDEIQDFDFSKVDENMILVCRKQNIEDYRAYMRKKDDPTDPNPDAPTINKKATARVKVYCIKDFYRFLHENEYLSRNVMEYVHVESKDNTDETKHAIALELDEVAALLGSTREAHRERDLCILVMFLTTGMRLNELVNLNVCDIKFGEDMLINIRRGKGSKTRVIPMNVQCANQVKRYLAIRQKQVDEQNLNELPNGNNPLFLSQENHRISRRRVQSIVERAITAAGLGGKNYSTHKLRHTAATLLYNNGADLNLLKSILGHNTIQTTTIYAHPDIEARRAAIDLNPIAKIDLGALETINAARKLFPLEEEDGNQTSKEGD